MPTYRHVFPAALRLEGFTEAQIQTMDLALISAYQKFDREFEAKVQLSWQLRQECGARAAERRARNIMATLALVGWVLALAALGGAV